MSNYQIVQALIAQFSGQHNTIGVPRVLCKLMGSLDFQYPQADRDG